MARGDLTLFEELAVTIGNESHDFNTDAFKLGIISSVTAPTAADATPEWSDYSANQVTTNAAYSDGGPTIGNTTYNETNGTAIFVGSSVVVSQNSSGSTALFWGIVYNSASSKGIGFLDLGGPVDQTAGDVTVNWNSSGIFKLTIS